jgi:hypothetical protein
MTITPLLIVIMVAGLVAAWFAGKFVAARNLPLAFILAWLALAFLLSFVRFPVV